MLVKYIDGDATAGIPITADAEEFWVYFFDDAFGDIDGAGFVEGTVIAIGKEIEFERFTLDHFLGRNVIDHNMGEIWLAGDRAQRGEFGASEAYQIIDIRVGVRH